MIPQAYEFKRIASRFRQVSTFGFLFEGIETAPVYYFDDQESFDSDEVGALRAQIITGPLRLPHPCVVFEVTVGSHRAARRWARVPIYRTGLSP